MSLESVRQAEPGERERSRHLTARLYAGEIASYDLETRCLRKDGSVVWLHLSVGLIRDDAGAPAYELAVIEDISQRKLLEGERAASERRHRDALVREVHHRIKNHVQGVVGLLRQQARRAAVARRVATVRAGPRDARAWGLPRP